MTDEFEKVVAEHSEYLQLRQLTDFMRATRDLLDEKGAEISRLQVEVANLKQYIDGIESEFEKENKKLRGALIEERAKYNALSGWYLDEDDYARLSDDLSGDGEIPGRQFFQNEAESELWAEMPEVDWDASD